jgi:hypothetical protein
MNTEVARHLLGVPEETTLTISVVEKAHRRALLIFHPDKGGTHEQCVRLQEAYQTLVAKLRGVITPPDFNDPNVIERCRRYENQALHGDDIDRIVYETMRAFPGVAWPSVWPPAEDPVLTLVAVSGGAVTSGVQEAAPKQEKKGKRKRDHLESYNNPGQKADEVAGNKKRRSRQPKSKKCDEEATKTYIKRPVGAAPKDQYGNRKQWNHVTGAWREADEAI